MTTWWKRLRYLLALAGLCAIATCPQAKRACVHDQRAREATRLLGELGERVTDTVAATGKVPPLGAGPTPSAGCCVRGDSCDPDASQWDAPGWRALRFSVDGPSRYAYEYIPDPSGAAAVVRATGDLACDGHVERVELRLEIRDGHVERAWNQAAVSE
jgi:hypothetical protein